MIESSIRALTTAIQLVEPQYVASVTETPIPAKQLLDAQQSLSVQPPCNLVDSRIKDRERCERQVVVVTGSANSSGFSVIAFKFQEIKDLGKLSPIANFTLAQNSDPRPNDGDPSNAGIMSHNFVSSCCCTTIIRIGPQSKN